jgi:capsule polysaccharide modification protein KpsS
MKEHPMDLFRKSYQRKNAHGVYWVDPATSISHILNRTNCLATLVMNSTAGLESLILQKPVLCLGNALYCYPELVEIPDALDTMSLLCSLKKLVEYKVDSTLVKQFCGFLYDTTQLEGNIDSTPEKNEVLHCCASIKNRLQTR